MTLTHLSATENTRNVLDQTENGQLRDENLRTEKMEFLDSDTDREIETDAEDSKITQKYTVSLMVSNNLGFGPNRFLEVKSLRLTRDSRVNEKIRMAIFDSKISSQRTCN